MCQTLRVGLTYVWRGNEKLPNIQISHQENIKPSGASNWDQSQPFAKDSVEKKIKTEKKGEEKSCYIRKYLFVWFFIVQRNIDIIFPVEIISRNKLKIAQTTIKILRTNVSLSENWQACVADPRPEGDPTTWKRSSPTLKADSPLDFLKNLWLWTDL